jgi:hypothetical protein
MCGQLHAPVALLPGREPSVPIGYEAGLTPEPVWKLWRKEKFLVPTENLTPTVRLVARWYTDWAIQAHQFIMYLCKNLNNRS